MKKTLFILAAFGLIAASCAKEVMKSNNTEIKTKGRTVLTVSLPEDGKVNIGPENGRKLYWSKDDRLSWNGIPSLPLDEKYDGLQSAEFEWDDVLNRPARILYPASAWVDNELEGSIGKIKILKVQGTMNGEDDIVNNSFPMCCYIESGKPSTLSPLFAIVHLKIVKAEGAEDINIKQIGFRGNKQEWITQPLTVDFDTKEITDFGSGYEGSSNWTYVNCDKTLTTSTPICVNVAVPAINYASGFQLSINDMYGNTMNQKKSSGIKLEAGKIYNFPELTYKPSLESHDIKNADELIKFAHLFNSKALGDGSEMTINIVEDLDFTGKEFIEIGDYEKGISFNGTIETTEGKVIKNLTTTTFGQFYNLANLGFKFDSSCKINVPISNATEWNAFAESYNKGNFGTDSSAGKIITVNLTDNLDFIGIDVKTVGNYGGGNYFNGIINGCNKTVKNLQSSNALVGAVGSKGAIKDLTIDESCSYTVDYEVGVQKHFGPFTEYVKGDMTNCHNKAAITLSSNGNLNDMNIYVGGLVGRINEGLLEDCTNSGTIFLDGTYSSANNLYAGGIVGYMSNAGGKVKDCTNYGSISTAALCNTTVMGGIAAVCNGTIEGCTNETTGIISSAMARPTGDACKFIYYGGIAGKLNNATAISNVNKAEIKTTSAVKQHYMGGIVGLVEGTVTVSDNTSSGNVSSTGGARNLYMGGLYGSFDESNTLKITGSPFTGAISISGHESASSVYLFAGGIVGLAKKGLTIEGTSCILENNITIPASSSTAVELFMGGVVGAVGESGNGDVKDGEKVTISGITVSGNVKMEGGSGLTPKYKKAAFGGIIGGAFAGADISNCTSSAKVYFGEALMASGSNGNPSHLGGIAGRIEGGKSTISNCTASGNIYNYLYNNNVWNILTHSGCCCNGGIVGSFGYNLNNEYSIEILGCSTGTTQYSYRGAVGCIAGYLSRATISDCNCLTGSIKRGAPAGGIAGAAENSEITNCTVKLSEITGMKGGSCIANVGGILGYGVGSTLNKCKAFSTLTSDSNIVGGIIGTADNCTIGSNSTNKCTFGGSVAGKEISSNNYTDYVIGVNSGTTTVNVGYWDGKIINSQ